MNNAIKHAFADAGIIDEVYPTAHAIDRARLRFGVSEAQAQTWFNELIAKAERTGVTEDGCDVYETEGKRLIVNPDARTVVTIYGKPALDFLAPVFEREMRKIKRRYTRMIRANELEYAKILKDIADSAYNRARARNPQTRDLIAERIAEMQTEADAIVRRIEKLESMREQKVRAIENAY